MVKPQYFSLDIEDSGEYNMLSLGACLVFDTDQQFYAELQPRHKRYNIEAMKVGCSELDLLKELGQEYNTKSPQFSPEKVLDILEEKGEHPTDAFNRLRDWTREVTPKGYTPELICGPVLFDGGRVDFYFSEFAGGNNPFGYGGTDINSLFQGLVRKERASMRGIYGNIAENKREHNALEDAIFQAHISRPLIEALRTGRLPEFMKDVETY